MRRVIGGKAVNEFQVIPECLHILRVCQPGPDFASAACQVRERIFATLRLRRLAAGEMDAQFAEELAQRDQLLGPGVAGSLADPDPRAWGLAGTELATATVGTVRLKLLKVAAQVTVSVRRVYVRLSSAFPLQGLFRCCVQRLLALNPAVT